MARIALRSNPEGVDTEVLDDIAHAADLPSGEVCLLVGDPLLGEDYQAVYIPRAFVPSYGNIAGLENHLDKPWDCGVSIHENWAARQPKYPAVFAYLLGHEFGHVKTALTRLWLAAYEALLFDVTVVSGRSEWRYDELPHEIRYDQFGLAVADATYGIDSVRGEIQRLLEGGRERDEERLEKLLTLSPRLELSGLREDMAAFALPYKDALVAKWTEDVRDGRPGMAKYLKKLDALWDPS